MDCPIGRAVCDVSPDGMAVLNPDGKMNVTLL
jgi:hypothetical protein